MTLRIRRTSTWLVGVAMLLAACGSAVHPAPGAEGTSEKQALAAHRGSDPAGVPWTGFALSSPYAAVGDATTSPASVSCINATFCVAVAPFASLDAPQGSALWGAGLSFVYDGSTWKDYLIPGGADADSVSCVSTTFCMAVSFAGGFVFDGSGWSQVPGFVDANAVSCVSTTFCMAVGLEDVITTAVYDYQGSAWSLSRTFPAVAELTAISCPSATFCAADGAGQVVTYDGSDWSSPTTFTQGGNTVSCVSETFCMSVGTGPHSGGGLTVDEFASAYAPGGWSPPGRIGTDSFSDPIDSISCATSSLCIAGGRAASVLEYDGQGWTSVWTPPSSASISAVSCTAARFCAAVGLGEAFTVASV